MEKGRVHSVKVRSFNSVVGGGPWPQRKTVQDVLRLHNSLSSQLSWALRDLKSYLKRSGRPNKATVTKYENKIARYRKRVLQNVKVIQALRRYGLLSVDRDLILPIIPYIFRAVDEEARLQEGRDRLRLSDSFESSEAQIDYMVQQMFAGFIEVNESVNRYYPGELPELLKSMHGYGELPELLKFIRGYGDRYKHPKTGDLNVSQYITHEILEAYLSLLWSMYHDIFFTGTEDEKPGALQEGPEMTPKEALRVVK
jgi:hypothetical protein